MQYISDLHLEFYDNQIHPEQFVLPIAPYLALVGDIGIPELETYRAFLTWCSSKWKAVFLVAGNHEYYNVKCPSKGTMENKRMLIQEICSSLSNVYFLDCSSVVLPELNLRILGCTLWSHIPEELYDKALTYMNDSRQILLEPKKPFAPWDISERHAREKAWLHQAIRNSKEPCLVLTHYLPSYSLIAEKYQGSPLNCCFASDCHDLFLPPVVGWICGHTHTGMKVDIHGIPCCINPYGYPSEDVETRNTMAVFPL